MEIFHTFIAASSALRSLTIHPAPPLCMCVGYGGSGGAPLRLHPAPPSLILQLPGIKRCIRPRYSFTLEGCWAIQWYVTDSMCRV
jgi:hypothetical protein